MIEHEVETHPWKPFVPAGARMLILGAFPPGAHRWSMEFYYPNRTNDFWKIMGLLFLGDREALYDPVAKRYDLAAIKRLLTERGIAMHDAAHRVMRLKGNASDKHLEVVEPVALHDLLATMPHCHTVATTGEKAASVVAALTQTPVPAKGEMVVSGEGLEIWRMPSTSRAYPLPLEQKAAYYERMFRHAGLL